ncbi:tetratricopeptide (TPR) repeat protein [Virgibacillus natechei]|uniref:Tetratricopeptide (TPR) repeat protein n=1 Tax=Virgibacillus natechei TaxID=1216297 RepID=A0ABS4IEJ8_9BACI|nr:SEC-C metal-binding domain-containing protein [Virgibacillus natechei]MBP1969362.1 tetratricopeptide (TPR) repeat protein [Virgibacillus natechei]UZD12508.1 SEC-C metal-binding domain-containing protein [Virgibacillus natechei]
MSKTGRNDPCPCGSGKKYKKCCGASNVVEMGMGRYNTELERLRNTLIAFAIYEHEFDLEKIIDKYPQPALLHDDELMDTYMTGLTPWMIVNAPIFANDQTIYDVFNKKEQSKIKHTRIKNTFEEWGNSKPSIYEILSTDQQANKKATLQDVLTNETYDIALDEENDFEEVNLVTGILVPYIDHHQFLFPMIELPSDSKEKVIDLAKNYMDGAGDAGLAVDFPDFLGEALAIQANTIELEWDNPTHELVANHFENHMRAKGFDDKMISAGVLLWNIYCEKANPSFRKLGPSAAAIDYLIHHTLVPDTIVTQSQLAKEYETSAGSISKMVKRIEKELDEEMEHLFHEMIEEGILDEEAVDSFDEDILSNNNMNMEKTMRDLQNALEGQNFDSEEEVQPFMDELMKNQELPSPVSSSPRDLAQDKLYEAQVEKGAKRRKLIKEALDIYPNSPDAYLLMAADTSSMNEQHSLFHQALLAGEKDLGKDFFKENKGHFWLMIETRPYMRAKADYATVQYNLGDKESAMEHYEELLELNPNDNQGIRYQLLRIYLEEEKYVPAKHLIKQYEKEQSANFLFNEALLHYRTNGITPKTKALLKKATEQNPYVKDYLLDKKPIPRHSQDFMGIGDESEAIVYAQEHIHLWKEAQALLKEL